MRSVSLALRLAVGLLSVYAIGLGVRHYVYKVQEVFWDAPLPFTLESALYFRRVEQVLNNGRLPEVDKGIQYPQGVVVRENDTVGSEYVYAALTRLFPASFTLENRLRWIEAAWFCLGIPLMVLWVGWWRQSWTGGFLAGLLYAVALSSVVRSTGQELSHENVALPLLLGHLAFAVLARRGGGGMAVAATILSAACLALAQTAWDLVQFYVVLWAIGSLWRVFAEPAPDDRGAWRLYAASMGALGVSALINPYMRAHGFLISPVYLLSVGVVVAWGLRRFEALPRRVVWQAVVVVGFVLAGWWLATRYHQSYDHFAGLLAAKLRYLNHKPEDPALLTFDQRIMWVPALHSTTWSMIWSTFPAMLLLTCAAFPLLSRSSNIRRDPEIIQLLISYAASLITFILFYRFHVFLAVFAAVGLGVLAGETIRRRDWIPWVVMPLLAFGVVVEALQVLRQPERWGRGFYYDEVRELTRWMREHAAGRPVLANFGISASLAAYSGCPVVLHPKFEGAEIRNRVRTYGEALFSGDEKHLRDWAGRYGAEYLVFALGEFSSIAPSQQMRYFVNVLSPPAQAAARLLDKNPERARYFLYQWGNRKYRVFKILTSADERTAGNYSRQAEERLQQGDLDRAESWSLASIRLQPWNEQALMVLKHVGALRDQGFKAGQHE